MTAPQSPQDEIFGTGRIASPFQAPDGKAFALYHDGQTTVWYYRDTNQAVIQTSAPQAKIPEIKRTLVEKIEMAVETSSHVIQRAKEFIEKSQQSITRAQDAIIKNRNEIAAYQRVLLQVEQQWPDQGGFDDDEF